MTHPTDPKGRECSEAASSNEAGKVEELAKEIMDAFGGIDCERNVAYIDEMEVSNIAKFILNRESALRQRVEELEDGKKTLSELVDVEQEYSKALCVQLKDLERQVSSLERELEIAKRGLRFYADETHWTKDNWGVLGVNYDGGKKARQTLAEMEKETRG